MTEFPISEELADALTPLLDRELELYLEERALYRELVAAHAHRGIKPPQKPRHRLVRKRKSAEPARARPSGVNVARQELEVALVDIDGPSLSAGLYGGRPRE